MVNGTKSIFGNGTVEFTKWSQDYKDADEDAARQKLAEEQPESANEELKQALIAMVAAMGVPVAAANPVAVAAALQTTHAGFVQFVTFTNVVSVKIGTIMIMLANAGYHAAASKIHSVAQAVYQNLPNIQGYFTFANLQTAVGHAITAVQSLSFLKQYFSGGGDGGEQSAIGGPEPLLENPAQEKPKETPKEKKEKHLLERVARQTESLMHYALGGDKIHPFIPGVRGTRASFLKKGRRRGVKRRGVKLAQIAKGLPTTPQTGVPPISHLGKLREFFDERQTPISRQKSARKEQVHPPPEFSWHKDGVMGGATEAMIDVLVPHSSKQGVYAHQNMPGRLNHERIVMGVMSQAAKSSLRVDGTALGKQLVGVERKAESLFSAGTFPFKAPVRNQKRWEELELELHGSLEHMHKQLGRAVEEKQVLPEPSSDPSVDRVAQMYDPETLPQHDSNTDHLTQHIAGQAGGHPQILKIDTPSEMNHHGDVQV